VLLLLRLLLLLLMMMMMMMMMNVSLYVASDYHSVAELKLVKSCTRQQN